MKKDFEFKRPRILDYFKNYEKVDEVNKIKLVNYFKIIFIVLSYVLSHLKFFLT